jgi:hypothetical protein
VEATSRGDLFQSAVAETSFHQPQKFTALQYQATYKPQQGSKRLQLSFSLKEISSNGQKYFGRSFRF